jgi:hypothetical protein
VLFKKPGDDTLYRGKTQGFSKPTIINTKLRLTETQYARVKHGLLPEEMEDKWFAYFTENKLCFHRSWTGAKIYETPIQIIDNDGYMITEIAVERDVDLYSNADDGEDIRSFMFLLGRGLLGLNVELPNKSGNDEDILKSWSSFGRMIL